MLGLSVGLSHWACGTRNGWQNFFTSHWKDKRVRCTPTHTYTYTSYTWQCVNICALAEGTHRLCPSAWQSYCCWFLKWPLQYFRLFCHCVINKETLRPTTRQLNDGSANLSGLLLHINAPFADKQIDRQTYEHTMDWWMDCPSASKGSRCAPHAAC